MAKPEEWLNLRVETPLEPELPICDPHHHLWGHPDYSLEELVKDTAGGHNIVQTVFIESWARFRKDAPPDMPPVSETEFVQNMVTRSQVRPVKTNFAAGIVGFADLTQGAAVAPVLEAHIAAGEGRFRGIRYISAWDASSDLASPMNAPRGILSDLNFRKGFAALQKYNLSFDAWLFHPQLMELVELARSFPDTTIILDHMGGPLGIGPYASNRDQVFLEWKRGISVLAACPNVFVKIGGFGMPIYGFNWHHQPVPPGSIELAEAFKPYYSWCIEQFGTKRCMFESNFPIDKLSYSYTVLWNAFKRLTRSLSYEERRALFHDTAAKACRLQSTPKNQTGEIWRNPDNS